MLRTEASGLADRLREGAEALRAAGCASPRHDAERLAAWALRRSWGELWTVLREPLPAAAAVRLRDALARRAGGEPLAYITGSAVFCGLELSCGPGVLVPRPETETLADTALSLIEQTEHPVVVDLGTGAGALALAVAARRPDARVWATDSSAEALAYAAANRDRLAPGVELRRGDLFGALPERLRGALDLVVSNPPYVPRDADLPREVRREPAEALHAGASGAEMLLRIAAEAPPWLRPGGGVALEVGTAEQAGLVASSLGAAARVRDDHTGRPRVVWARI